MVKDVFCSNLAKGQKIFFSVRQCYSLNVQLGEHIYLLAMLKCSFSVSVDCTGLKRELIVILS